MVQRYEQTRKLQWYKRGAAYEERRVKSEEFKRKAYEFFTLHSSFFTFLAP